MLKLKNSVLSVEALDKLEANTNDIGPTGEFQLAAIPVEDLNLLLTPSELS